MKKTMMKFFALVLAALFALTIPTNARTIYNYETNSTDEVLESFNLSEKIIDEVESEILSGEISDHEAVIGLALAECLGVVKTDVPQVDNEGLPQIAQVISTTPSADGTIEKEVAYSTLVILDENEHALTSEELVSMTNTSSGTLKEYSIDATHTGYFTLKVDQLGRITAARLDKMVTVLTYNSTSKASKLVQVYVADPAPYQTEYFETSKTTNSPAARTTYSYSPDSVFYVTNRYGTSIGSRAEIYCGSKVLVVRETYPLD